jgi:hypothetical protein
MGRFTISGRVLDSSRNGVVDVELQVGTCSIRVCFLSVVRRSPDMACIPHRYAGLQNQEKSWNEEE